MGRMETVSPSWSDPCDRDHIWEGLQGVQAGEMAERRPVHERVGLQVRCIQRRPKALPGEGFRLVPDEVHRRLRTVPVPGEGSGRPPRGAEVGADNVREARA